VKLVIVGGSSQSTPNLFRSKAVQAAGLSVVLIGRSAANLHAVRRAIKVVSGDAVSPDVSMAPQNLSAALIGADIVLLQARYGGFLGRIFDETFPLKYDICGDEGLGPGGLASAWRSWPQIDRLLTEVRRICPRATVVLMTSPVGILSRASLLKFGDLNIWGICELPWTTLCSACKTLDIDPAKVSFGYAGVNHLGWLHHLRLGRTNLLERYAVKRSRSKGFPTRALIEACQGIPLRYLRLHYYPQEVLHEQTTSATSRGRALQVLHTITMKIFVKGSRAEVLGVLQKRPAPWYEHAIVPFILSLQTPQRDRIVYFLTTFNRGHISEFHDDEVLEVPHVIANARPVRLDGASSPPSRVTETLRPYIEYESLAADAVVRRDTGRLERAIAIHPWVRGAHLGAPLGNEVVRGIRPQRGYKSATSGSRILSANLSFDQNL
jgi:6-phospho-beta-glucosidase